MLSIEQRNTLSCTTPRQHEHAMHGFDMPLDASIVAEYSSERRKNAYGENKEHGITIAIDDELNWAATCAWDRFCGRRG